LIEHSPPDTEVVSLNHFTETVPGYQYSLGQVILTLALILSANVALRAVAQVMKIMEPVFEGTIETPHWTTGRWWLLRLGYYMLCRPKDRATDWIWIIDHSNQIGQERCLLILGIRLQKLPPAGERLCLKDMEVIDLVPVVESDKQIVFDQLNAAAQKMDVPRAIIHDNGGDLAGGLALFREQHPTTAGIYDITHKAACLLKARLEKDPTWKAFCTQTGQTKFQTQQTELAFLVPPSQRSKARFMNLGPLIKWAQVALATIERPPSEVLRHVAPERLEEKLGWLREYRKPLRDWSEMQQMIDVTVDFVRCNGHYRGSAEDLRRSIMPLYVNTPAQALRDELVAFVEGESQKAQKGERLPGSSEVLESAFGKFKEIEGNQSKGGFTALLLALPAILGGLTADTVRKALEFAKTQDITKWIRDHLGESHQSKRRATYNAISGQGKEPKPTAKKAAVANERRRAEKRGKKKIYWSKHPSRAGRKRIKSGRKTSRKPVRDS